MITYKDSEKLLAEYSDEYYKVPFVPFPSVTAAVESITETASYIYSTEGEEFVLEVARKLKEWVDRQRHQVDNP